MFFQIIVFFIKTVYCFIPH
uniref:Uncharacterized protein n=1 Tax=Schistosoma japonicum TaxID=6182 RepID=Q5BZ79_SCHJA|nr:unknown [Schistosoma japonicum]